jgi:hypothetical protein
MVKLLDHIPWTLVLLLCIFLGLAPLSPLPHLFEKIQMLLNGELKRNVDIFDLLFHASPFVLLFLKVFFRFLGGNR